MPMPLSDVEAQAKLLTAEERARLAEILLESLDGSQAPDVQQAWHHEISQRAAAYDHGNAETHRAEAVFSEARRILQ